MRCSTRGIIIRVKSVGDDRLLTVLTEDFGVINAAARGANRPRSGLASSTELFCYCRLVLFRYRDSITVDSAEVECSFFELRQELESLSLASYIAELCVELAPPEEPAGEYLRLILNTLHMLVKKKRSVWLLKPLFELRLLTMAGFMPDLTGCACCGEFEPEKDMLFSVSSGELTCLECAKQQKEQADKLPERILLHAAVLAAMRHIIYSRFEQLFSFSLPQEALLELNRVSESYLKFHLQRDYRSLEFFYSVAQLVEKDFSTS